MKTTKLILSILVLSIFFTSCSEDSTPRVLGDYDNGILVSAEGAFGAKDGSISYTNEDLTATTDFVYNAVNGAQLGGLIQSIAFNDDEAYIILNDVNTIVIADRYTLEKISEITTGLSNPRYMTVANGKGYVTNWGSGADATDDYLAVIDLSTNQIEDTIISLDEGVEQIVSVDDKLYVTHKGAWSTNNIVSVVDLSADNAVTEIEVNDNPDEIIIDDSGNLIVLSEGQALTWNEDFTEVLTATTSSISFINTTSDTVTKTLELPENNVSTLLSYENGSIYYYDNTNDTVNEIDESSSVLSSTGIDVGLIYGMSVNDGNLYTTTYNFVDLSELIVYNISSEETIYSREVGLGASKIYFN